MLGTLGTPRTLRKRRIAGFDWSPLKNPTPVPVTKSTDRSPLPRLAEIEIDPPHKMNSQGWSLEDELACTARCKYCSQPIVWGEVQDYKPNETRTDWIRVATDRKWMPLDPDMFPHGCEASSAETGSRPQSGGQP